MLRILPRIAFKSPPCQWLGSKGFVWVVIVGLINVRVVSWPDLVKDLVLPQLKSENDLNFKFSRFHFLGFAASLDFAH